MLIYNNIKHKTMHYTQISPSKQLAKDAEEWQYSIAGQEATLNATTWHSTELGHKYQMHFLITTRSGALLASAQDDDRRKKLMFCIDPIISISPTYNKFDQVTTFEILIYNFQTG